MRVWFLKNSFLNKEIFSNEQAQVFALYLFINYKQAVLEIMYENNIHSILSQTYKHMSIMNKIKAGIIIPVMLLTSNLSAQDVPLNYEEENTGAGCSVSAGSLEYHEKLPNPFEFNDGSMVQTFEDWTCRRNEIKADIEKYEIMEKPDRPSDITASYSGGKLTVTIKENGKTLTLSSSFSIPSGTGLHPIVIGMNSGTGTLSSSLFSGVVQVPFNHDQVCTYQMSGGKDLNAPFYQMYPTHTSAGDYCGWSWGVSRLIDGLEIIADDYNLDLERIAVTGCSYAGKMALFAGAFDERVTLTIAQESGGGGINSWRISDEYAKRVENVEKIDNTSGTWFMNSMRSLDPYKLPHDHHELIAMIAPRAFLAFGNPPYGWMCDESGYKSCMAALEVWKAMGVEDRFGFNFDGGHSHCQATSAQNSAVTAFVDKFLRNKTSTNTEIRVEPSQSGFIIDNYADYYDWEPLGQVTFKPNAPKLSFTSPSETTILEGEEITISVSVEDKNNDVQKVDFFIDDEKIGEKQSPPYSIKWSGDVAGVYQIKATVTDQEGNVASASLSIKVRVPQGPYEGTPHIVPGKIELEHFDVGGNGYAYYDSSTGSETGVSFRDDEDVDIEECSDTGGGYNLGWTAAGEWLEYTVNVASAGTYDIELRAACSESDRSVSLSSDGNTIASFDIPNTGGWQEWETITVKDIELDEGEQVIRLTIGDENYVNLNYIEFTTDAVLPTIKLTSPGTKREFTTNETILISADASATDATVSDVKFYAADKLLNTDYTSPYLYNWSGMDAGSYVIKAQVTDSKGLTASETVNIVITEAPAIIQLKAGWNLIGCPISGNTPIEEALSSIWDDVEVVKDFNAFWDESNTPALNSLNSVDWGKGYFVKVKNDCELTW